MTDDLPLFGISAGAPDSTAPTLLATPFSPDLPFRIRPVDPAFAPLEEIVAGTYREAEAVAKIAARRDRAVWKVFLADKAGGEALCAVVNPPDQRGMQWIDMHGPGCALCHD